MPIRFAWLRALRRALVRLAIVLPAILPLPASAQQSTPITVEQLKRSLDWVEAALGADRIGPAGLVELRQTIISTRDELRTRIEELEPRVVAIEARLKLLGPAPAKDAPPEEPAVAAEREQLAQSFSQVDGALKQARQLAVRSEQLGERITGRRHTLYTRELFVRTPSLIDPSFWSEVAGALPSEWHTLRNMLRSWRAAVATADGAARALAASLLLLGILGAAIAITRWWLPRLDAGPRADTRFARARTGLWVFIWLAVRTPLATIAAVLALEAFGLLPARMGELAQGLIVAVIVAAFGRGVARGLLAPDKPERRLVRLDDHTALCFHDHLIWSARAFAVAIVLQVAHKTLYASPLLVIATNILFAVAVAALLLHLIRCLRRAEISGQGEPIVQVPGVRLLALILAVMIVGALVAGYAGLAAFTALRVVVGAAVIGATYLLLVTTDALFTEALNQETARGRAIAASLGVSGRNIGLIGTLLSAAIRVSLIVLALLIIVGPWEASTADLFDSLRSIPLGFRIGEITVSFRAVLAAAAALFILLLVTRVVQGWLQNEFLPRTALEPSLQLSIATIFGYVGIIVAISLALGALGIDLQKIALVAGALSVGIGFGLQAIVSNFVSGLILLAERPIRVGDSIAVKGEEGWVRRIRVRATEIETFERASVIIPNSELITGLVKNWTRANTLGRIIVKIGVGYDSDPHKVRDILLGIATGHPQIIQTPPPRAFLVGFGDSSLDFELRCVVANVENSLSVKSDVHFAILRQFRAAGIEIPYPQREIRTREKA